jgi:hypothetical protein
MNAIVSFFLPDNVGSKLSIFNIPIIAVLQAFSVVVGAALTRFFADPRVVDAQKFNDWENHRHLIRELFYWSVLTILITLAIRFLVGSGVHLRMTYNREILDSLHRTVFRFLKDLFFLFAFGAFLVRGVLANKVRSFARWLTLFSCTGCFWSVVEYFYYTQHPDPFAKIWFFINLFQFAATSICWQLAPKGEETKRCLWIVVSLMVIFVIIFCIDLDHILRNSVPLS